MKSSVYREAFLKLQVDEQENQPFVIKLSIKDYLKQLPPSLARVFQGKNKKVRHQNKL